MKNVLILVGLLSLLLAGCVVEKPQSPSVRVTERIIDFQDGTRLEFRCDGFSKYAFDEYIRARGTIFVEKVSESSGLFKTITFGDSLLKTRVVYPDYFVLLPYSENISKVELSRCLYVEPFRFNITDEGFSTRQASCRLSYSECYDNPYDCLNGCFSQGKVVS